MYLAAQRVRARDGREGVNVVGYTHRGEDHPGIDWRNPDVVHIAEAEPGRLMFTVRSLEMAGNAVRSFLDIAVSDGVPAKTVASLLEAAAVSRRPEPSQSSVWKQGPMSLRLYVAPSLQTPAAVEFRELRAKMLFTIANVVTNVRKVPTLVTKPPQAIHFSRHRGPVSDRYLVDSASREALRRLVGDATIPASVNVTHENAEAFAHFVGGDLVAEIVLTFTNCTLDQLDALGGALVVDEAGREVWKSPGLKLGIR